MRYQDALAAGQGGSKIAPQSQAPAPQEPAKISRRSKAFSDYRQRFAAYLEHSNSSLHDAALQRARALLDEEERRRSTPKKMPARKRILRPPASPPRKRGGQPGNKNALKRGRYKSSSREFLRIVHSFATHTYAALDELGFYRRRLGSRRRGGQPGNQNALKHGRFARKQQKPANDSSDQVNDARPTT